MKTFACIALLSIGLFTSIRVNAADLSKKRVLYIDSYHQGYMWTDGIMDGVKSVLEPSGVKFKIVHMDTKRNTSKEFMVKAVDLMKKEITEFKPDIIIASDDNASKYLIMPYYRNGKIPVIFCGVNWDASIYGYPYKNATGMVEVSLIPSLLKRLSKYAKGKHRLGYLSTDNLTARKEAENYQKVFKLKTNEVYVKTFEDWKEKFIEIQNNVDLLIIGNNAGIKNWNEEEAEAFALKNTKIPTGVIYDFLAKYSLLGFTKLASEQGEWAATSAIEVLNGKKISDIPITKNRKGQLFLNLNIAKKLGVIFSPKLIKNAKVIK